ncbi:MAG: hypothetical protein MZV49_25215 [Rhodopseudomonas palustris]|nr:hypothetical protein [Rhodopseudomonas palustris]
MVDMLRESAQPVPAVKVNGFEASLAAGPFGAYRVDPRFELARRGHVEARGTADVEVEADPPILRRRRLTHVHREQWRCGADQVHLELVAKHRRLAVVEDGPVIG